jgi:hypothetical protein
MPFIFLTLAFHKEALPLAPARVSYSLAFEVSGKELHAHSSAHCRKPDILGIGNAQTLSSCPSLPSP